MNQKIKAVLFDMDGTIIHTLKQWDLIIGLIVGSHNIKRYRSLREKSSDKSMKGICEVLRNHFEFTQGDIEIEAMFRNTAREVFSHLKPRFIPGFKQFHISLKQSGKATALLTNAPDYALDTLKEVLSLEDFFEGHIYNSCDVNYQFKPHPAIYLHALRQLEVDPEQCIVFEDTIRGFESALNAGISHIVSINGENSSLPIKRVKNYKMLSLCDLFGGDIAKIGD